MARLSAGKVKDSSVRLNVGRIDMLDSSYDIGLKEVFVVDNKVYLVLHEPVEEVGLSVNDLKKLLALIEAS